MLVLIAAAGAASADAPGATPAPGDRVRVRCPTLARSPIVGILKSADAQELTIERDGASMTLQRDAVVGLERSLGRRARLSTRVGGAVLGAMLLGATTGGKACAMICPEEGPCPPCDTSLDASDYAVFAAGGVVGFFAGSLFKTEKWEKAGGPALALEARPTRRGARVALRFSF